MNLWRIALATGVLLTQAPAGAVVGLQAPDAAAQTAASPAQECWLGHAQVQPPPLREGALLKSGFGERYRLAAEQHAGAEHPTAARLRPCNALPPPIKMSAGDDSRP